MSKKFKSDEPTLLDWIPEPNPEEKRAACGKVTQLRIYTTNIIGVLVFCCHRWDCDICRGRHIQEIKKKILRRCSTWYAKFIDDTKYEATKKRIERAGGKYCAVGTPNVWLVMTNEKILEGSRILPQQLLSKAIEVVLSDSYVYRQRRFRHSDGLFPTGSTKSDVHLLRKIVVGEKKEEAVKKLINKGYWLRRRTEDVDFLEPRSEEAAETLLQGGTFDILWEE